MDTVAISYAWISDKYKEKIIGFVNYLRENGYNAVMDEFLKQRETAIDFNEMMATMIPNAQKVIVFLSAKYKMRADKFEGGVGFEYRILLNEIKSIPDKYIFVTFEKFSNIAPNDLLPDALGEREIIEIGEPGQEWEDVLFSKLTGRPRIVFAEVKETKREPKEVKIQKFNEKHIFHFKFTISEDRQNVSYDNDTLKEMLEWFTDKNSAFEVTIDDLHINSLSDWFKIKNTELENGCLKPEEEVDYQRVGETIRSLGERNNDIRKAIRYFLEDDVAKRVVNCIDFTHRDYLEVCRNIILVGRTMKMQSDVDGEKLVSIEGILKGFYFTAHVHKNKIEEKEWDYLSVGDGRITTFHHDDLVQGIIPSLYCYLCVFSTKRVLEKMDRKILTNLNGYIFGMH